MSRSTFAHHENISLSRTRVLGLDPGLRTTGFGVVDQIGTQIQYVASGTIKTGSGSLAERLKILFYGVSEVIQHYQPDEAAIEIVFVNVNPQSTLLLGQARGALICGAVSNSLAVSEYTALQIKQSVVGYGKAHKEQVQHMIQRLLALPATPGPDASDALACAICHIHGKRSHGLPQNTPRKYKRGGRILS